MPETTFQTKRLSAGEWHEVDPKGRLDLPTVVAEMLTEPVTRWLPPDWQGTYTRARAEAWIAERDAEGPVLLVVHRETTQPLGLILLFEEAVGDGVEVRVGYLLAELAWGQGYGGELLDGLVTWCRERGVVRSIIGGVAPENAASIRLLERHGFVLDGEAAPAGDLTFRLAIDR